MISISIAFFTLSLIFGLVAAYFSIKSWILWKNSALETIKARVFLSKSFLNHNFTLSLIIFWSLIGLVILHSIMEYIELTGSISYGFYIVYYGLFPVALLLLIFLTRMWYKILSTDRPFQ